VASYLDDLVKDLSLIELNKSKPEYIAWLAEQARAVQLMHLQRLDFFFL
jgi:hypothetical protein